ncbi:hypothetical protein [Rhizobium sp.]
MAPVIKTATAAGEAEWLRLRAGCLAVHKVDLIPEVAAATLPRR